MHEVVSPETVAVDPATFDDLPVTQTNFPLLQSYVVASLSALGFQGNQVSIEQGKIVTGEKTGIATPYMMRIRTRTGVVELLDDLVASSEEEPRGIRWGAFHDIRQKLVDVCPQLLTINPKSVMDLLRGGRVTTLPPHCRIFEDADAYKYAFDKGSILGCGEIETFSLASCYRLYCDPTSNKGIRNQDLERLAYEELLAFEAAMKVPNKTVYLYQPSGLIDSIVVFYFPDDVVDLPLTARAVDTASMVESSSTGDDAMGDEDFFDSEDGDRDGNVAQIDFDADLNRDVERELSQLCRRDLKVRILKSEFVLESLMTTFESAVVGVTEESRLLHISTRQLAHIYKGAIVEIKQKMKQLLTGNVLLLVKVEGWFLFAYAVPESEAQAFAFY